MSTINSTEQQHTEELRDRPWSSADTVEEEPSVSRTSDRPGLEDNLFISTKQIQSCFTAFSQSAEIFQELQQECMRRLHVPIGPTARSSSPSQTPVSNEDKPQIPPRVPIPPRHIKRGDYTCARWSQDLSLSPSPAELTEEPSGPDQERPPQIPPRDPLSGSRTPSPLSLVVSSPQTRVYSISPTATQSHTFGSYLSTSPSKPMPTTHSFASDPKYAAPKVIQAQGKEPANKGPCILPIVRDGRKVSNTHYYLLPERPPYLDRYDRFFREAESLPSAPVEERQGRHTNMATVKPMVVNTTVLGHSQGQGPVQTRDLKSNFSTNNNSSLGGPRSGMKTSVSLPRVCSEGPGSCPRTEGGGPSADLIRMVQEAVHGVTIEECQAALQNHSWNVQKSVHYLKVEQLFCLGLRSRSECLKLLEMCDWNLEVASTQMLDTYGSTTRQRR